MQSLLLPLAAFAGSFLAVLAANLADVYLFLFYDSNLKFKRISTKKKKKLKHE
jgi:hypothetical protein